MIEESGRVVLVEAGAVWVETVRKTGCGRCDEPGGCGNSALARHARERLGHVRALNRGNITLEIGDFVLVGVPADAVLQGAMLVYVLPLLMMVTGAFLGDFLGAALGDAEAGTLAGAVAGLAAAFIAVRLQARFSALNPRLHPVVIRRLAAPVATACER